MKDENYEKGKKMNEILEKNMKNLDIDMTELLNPVFNLKRILTEVNKKSNMEKRLWVIENICNSTIIHLTFIEKVFKEQKYESGLEHIIELQKNIANILGITIEDIKNNKNRCCPNSKDGYHAIFGDGDMSGNCIYCGRGCA